MSSGRPESKRDYFRIVRFLSVSVLMLGHACLTWRALGGSEGMRSPDPVLVDDHIFNYYSAVITRTFLSDSGTTAGYDPHFMAGYAKSILWPPSATLPEVAVFLFGGVSPALVYKLYVLIAFLAFPVCVWIATWWMERDAVTALLALGASLILFWTDVPTAYMRFGMVSFVLSSALGLLIGACFLRLIAGADRAARPAFLVLLPIGCLTHLTIPILLAPALGISYLFAMRRIAVRDQFWIWGTVLHTLIANSFWVIPGILLWSTRGPTERFFVNPEGLSRLLELFGRSPPMEPVLLAGGLIGMFAGGWRTRETQVLLAVACAWFFFLGYCAGQLGLWNSMQPGRNTLQLFVWCAPLTARAVTNLFSPVAARCGHRTAIGVYVVLAIGASLLVGPRLVQNITALFTNRGVLLPSKLPAEHLEVLGWIQSHTDAGDRLFFEERNRDVPAGPDPMATHRLAALVPLKADVELIGGPYLGVQLATRFTQIGDGEFIGRRPWTPADFAAYSRLYGVKYIVCWSLPAQFFCRSNPELVAVEHQTDSFLIGRILLPSKPAILGECRVRARLNEIRVEDAKAEEGKLILPYHWVPGLTTDKGVALSSIRLLDDPVPFIVVMDPPRDFVIRFDLWSLVRQ